MLTLEELDTLKIKVMPNIDFVKTCGACPEQYDAFIGEKQVGYLRLRHGVFSVETPFCGGDTVLLAYPKGDGIFEEDERDFYLDMARKAIAHGIANQTFYESLLSEYKQRDCYHTLRK